MSRLAGLSRWLEVPLGLGLGFAVLLCVLGSASLVLAPPPKNPVFAMVLGLVLLIGCCGILVPCVRLVLGPRAGRGLLSPAAVRVAAWVFLFLPLGGVLTGYYREKGPIALVQAGVYVFVFFSLRAAFRSRSTPPPVNRGDPLFVEAAQRARASVATLRSLFEARHPDIAVKVPFATDTGAVESVWGQLVDLGPDGMRVSLAAPPVSHRGSLPESLTVGLEALEDWHVTLADGTIQGAFTTRAEIAMRRRDGAAIPEGLAALERRLVE